MPNTIPAATVSRVAEQLLATGRIARGYLGIAMQSVRLPDNLVSSLGLQRNTGLIVVSVESGGPAEKAGVLVGDILGALEGQPGSNTDDIQPMLDPDPAGKYRTARLR